jgi:dCMP deaminase
VLSKIRDILGLTNVPLEEMRKDQKRIDWNSIFLLESLLWSYRSHDPQTQCGCVLVRNNTVLSTGYNGFIRKINDDALPNLRPSTPEQTISKYDFMIHAEHNAILNCVRDGISTTGATAYVTGEPCNWCLQYMWQAGISRIVYSDFNDPKMLKNESHKRIQTALLELMNPQQHLCVHLYDDYDVGYSNIDVLFIPFSNIDFSPIQDIFQKFVEKKD